MQPIFSQGSGAVPTEDQTLEVRLPALFLSLVISFRGPCPLPSQELALVF